MARPANIAPTARWLLRLCRISVDEAFLLLRRHARSHNLAPRSVADAVVNLRLRLERVAGSRAQESSP